jgi:hypothetical protein
MSSGTRILVATLISALFLLIYDIFVIRPRVEKQKQQLAKQSEQHLKETKEKILEKPQIKPSDNDIFRTPTALTSFALIDDDISKVIFSWGIIENVELKGFKLKVDSPNNFHYEKPFRFAFLKSDGKNEIIPSRFSQKGNKIYL